MKKFILLLFVSIVLSNEVFSQPKYALFIHGFESDSTSWSLSGTPNQWVAENVIAGYTYINYESSELSTIDGRKAVVLRIADAMFQKAPNAEWIIVGHSLGGILARVAYNEIKNIPAYANLNIQAVTTVASPSQGANAAHVSKTYNPKFVYVGGVLQSFKENLLKPLNNIAPITGVAVSLIAQDALSSIENAPLLFDSFYDELERYTQISGSIPAKNFIGRVIPGGNNDNSFIVKINSPDWLQPAHIRSVIGTEKRFIPVRAANEFFGIGGDERRTVQNFDQIRRFYRANADEWNFLNILLTITLNLEAASNARSYRNQWNKGRSELDNIDSKWAKVIDSYTYEYVQEVIAIPVGTCATDPGIPTGLPMPGGSPLSPDESCVNGVLYEFQTITNAYGIPTKNDGLVTPESCVWFTGDSTDDQIVNFLYDDIPDDGGYNHFEIKRYKRAYTLPGVFNQGDYAPPMRKTALWIKRNYEIEDI